MRIRMKCFVTALLALFFTPTLSNARTELILNTPLLPPYHYADMSGTIDQFLKEAFSRIDIGVTLQSLPPERALLNADNGIEDGDAIRIAGLSKVYPNLIQVPEIVTPFDFVAFSVKRQFVVKGWESLKPYAVGIVRGHKIAETNTAGFPSVTAADTVDQLFTLLKNDRIEIAISERGFGVETAKTLGVAGAKVLEPALATLDFYVYLNRKHEALVPRLAEVLKRMRQEKVLEKINAARE